MIGWVVEGKAIRDSYKPSAITAQNDVTLYLRHEMDVARIGNE